MMEDAVLSCVCRVASLESVLQTVGALKRTVDHVLITGKVPLMTFRLCFMLNSWASQLSRISV